MPPHSVGRALMTNQLEAALRAAVQNILDDAGDGYHCAQVVVCMGLERITSGGHIETTAWVWAPESQADWMTDGLLESAITMRIVADDDDD